VSFDERKRLKIRETELIVSPIPSGHSLGSVSWKIEFNKMNIFYALELNDQCQQVTPPV
jgi:Cft2 family RNA processing exonuclease